MHRPTLVLLSKNNNKNNKYITVLKFQTCFRWKGENVATTEVSDILTISDCLKEANVYGVQVPGDGHFLCAFDLRVSSIRIPWLPSTRTYKRDSNLVIDLLIKTGALSVLFVGHEGRIGMAAVTVMEGAQFDGSKIYEHVVSYLPSYARPRFIRIQVILFHTLNCIVLPWNM